jgi:hypothetical protein
MIRKLARVLSVPLVGLLLPLKVAAYKSPVRWIKRAILEFTSFIDWALVFANVQNPAMLIHQRVYRGAFLFGKAVMVVDHAVALRDIPKPTLRGNRFMGVDLVSNDPGAFVTNAGPITTGQPVRRLVREYIEREVMSPRVREYDVDTIRGDCAEIFADWRASEHMANMWTVRGAVTRVFLRLLAERTVPRELADDVTRAYVRRFAEFSLFGRYAPALLGVLGTRDGVRRDAFAPLRRLGIDDIVIDMTLFAAMFSVGTILMRSLEIAREENLDYRKLTRAERRGFVIEAQRLHPTVTTVHRIVEAPETIVVFDTTLELQPGDEVAYPFACLNRDPKCFEHPERFDLSRPQAEFERVLSWSVGPHACPARELSIAVTIAMLDELSEVSDLRALRPLNLEF